MTSNGAFAIEWHSTQDVAYMSTYQNNALYTFNVTNNYTKSSITFMTGTKNEFAMRYMPEGNEMVGFASNGSLSTITVFGYTLDTQVLIKEDRTFSSNVNGFAFDSSDPAYVLIWTSSEISFYQFKACPVGAYYSRCTGGCVVCTSSCSVCSAFGCKACEYYVAPTVNTTANTTTNTNSTTSNTTTLTPQNTTNTTIVSDNTTIPTPLSNDTI